MMTNKPLTEDNKYGTHTNPYFEVYDVKSAVQLLKERVKNYPDSTVVMPIGAKVRFLQMIDETFPVFKEEEDQNCPCGVVTCEGSVCDLNPEFKKKEKTK